MGRGRKLVRRRTKKKRVRSEDKGSNDSDEDYVFGEDEENGTSDNSECTSSIGDASEESFDFGPMSSSNEEDGEEERRVVRLKPQKGFSGRRKTSVKLPRKRTRVVYDDEEVDSDLDDEEFRPDEIVSVGGRQRRTLKPRKGSSARRKGGKRSRKRTRVLDDEKEVENENDDEEFMPHGIGCVGEKQRRISKPRRGSSIRTKRSRNRTRFLACYDDDDEDNGDTDDEEFTLDGIDCFDDEKDLHVSKNSRARKRSTRKKVSVKGLQRKRKSKVVKKPLGKKRRRSVLRRSVSSDDDFIVDNKVVKEKSKKNSGRRKKRSIVHSDSDFVCSGSSDFEYTVSEEEKEVVREASIFCGNLTNCLRNSSSPKRLQGDGASNRQKEKASGRKGENKVDDSQIEVRKQVCGICFSEEGKGVVQGTLNCCSHYFCFACIMEWSKVESRCPLCKQRFATISKPARSGVGVELRNVVIRVPKRDQVYQPSEEEVRGYLDPYENVVCMECQQAGDDHLMLLCDICDSPAHTYCVGLGWEVPEGNWYCEGCRPCDPGSPNSQVVDGVSDQVTSNSNLPTKLSTGEINAEGSGSTLQHSSSVPGPSFSSGIGVFPSPRYALGEDVQATSPVPGAGAATLSGRRRIHRQIHNLLSSNRMNQGAEMAGRPDRISQANLGSNFVNSERELGGETTHQNAIMLESDKSNFVSVEGRAQNSPCPMQVENTFSASFHLRRHVNEGPSNSTGTGSAHGAICCEHGEVNAASSHQQLNQCSNIAISGFDSSIFYHVNTEGTHFHAVKGANEQKGAKEQLQLLVRHHLKCLSRDTEVDYYIFKDIARHSTHSILAACGLDHNRSMAIPVQPPSSCSHVDREGEHKNLMKDCCSSCFNSFVRDTVRRIMNTRLQLRGLGK